MTFPTGTTFGRVVGRFLLAIADSDDAGREPDSAPPGGTITFVPQIPYLKFPSATPPTTVAPQPVVCTFDSNGDLLGPDGTVGVYLIATSYNVTIQLDAVPRPITYVIDVPAGGELNLTS